jgi:winged helix DNA-binding protein
MTTSITRLSWPEVSARRLERNGLTAAARRSFHRPADVAAAICGAHAQVMSAAELCIGLRLPGVTRADVRRALWEERSLVKTRGPRGTVHLLASADLPMWTGALTAIPPPPYVKGANALLTPEQTEQVVAAIADALSDAELTTEELTGEVVARTGSWAADPVMEAFQGNWPRWIQAKGIACNRGAMCFGPNRGRKTTYTSPRRWLPGFAPADERTALAELTRRYLYAYGPATAQQFAKWLAAPSGWVSKLLDSLAGELEEVELHGSRAWLVAGDTTMPAGTPRGVRLLPHFDAYGIACHPRELLFPGRAGERALARGQAGNYPVLLIDGTVAGVWHLRRSGRTLEITVEPLEPLSAKRRGELDEEVERVGEILEGTPRLTIGQVTVGPHA